MLFQYNLEKYSEIDNISKKYIEDNHLKQIIYDLFFALQGLFDCIPLTEQNLFSGHNYPIMDASEEFQISASLASMGLYRQSIISLRNVLELGLLSVYWNIDDLGHINIQNWKKSLEDTPRLPAIWKKLNAHKNIHKLQSVYDLKSDLLGLNELHDYVHYKGYKYGNNLGVMKGNIPEFIEISFQKWVSYSKKIIRIICILHLLKYPSATWDYNFHNKFGFEVPSFPHTQFGKVEMIKTLIGESLFDLIKQIAEQDDEFIEFKEWILSMPDMTEEQNKMQTINFYKFRIENEGYIKVLKFYEELNLESGKDIEVLKSLEPWSKENNYMEDKLSRVSKNLKTD